MAFLSRLRRFFLYVYFRYAYKPRFGASFDRWRLQRILICILVFGATVAVTTKLYPQLWLQTPFVTELESVGQLLPPDSQTTQEQQTLDVASTISFQASVVAPQHVKAHELQKRLEKNWHTIDAMLDSLQTSVVADITQDTTINPTEGEQPNEVPTATFSTSDHTHELSPRAVYEIAIEQQLQRVGEQIYAQSYNSRGLDGAALVAITIQPNGTLSSVQLLMSSGNDAIDAVLIDSVYAAAPFASLPESIALETLHMERWLRVTPYARTAE